MSRYL